MVGYFLTRRATRARSASIREPSACFEAILHSGGSVRLAYVKPGIEPLWVRDAFGITRDVSDNEGRFDRVRRLLRRALAAWGPLSSEQIRSALGIKTGSPAHQSMAGIIGALNAAGLNAAERLVRDNGRWRLGLDTELSFGSRSRLARAAMTGDVCALMRAHHIPRMTAGRHREEHA